MPKLIASTVESTSMKRFFLAAAVLFLTGCASTVIDESAGQPVGPAAHLTAAETVQNAESSPDESGADDASPPVEADPVVEGIVKAAKVVVGGVLLVVMLLGSLIISVV